MIRTRVLIGAVALGTLCAVGAAEAADKTWRLGRVYYRMVCTDCHKEQASGAISPSSRTKAEWAAYYDTDAHDASGKSNPSVSYYASREFRESVKDSNKAAAKLLDMPQADLMAAIRAFAEYGAKDSDNPQRCQ